MSRKTQRVVLIDQAREIISKVYDFMKKEANNNYAEKITDARWRTAQAVGVSEKTVSRILSEKRAHATEMSTLHAMDSNTEHAIGTSTSHATEPITEASNKRKNEEMIAESNLASTSSDIFTSPMKKRQLLDEEQSENISDMEEIKVKQELDVGPTVLQRPDIYFTTPSTIKIEPMDPKEDMPGPSELEFVKTEPDDLDTMNPAQNRDLSDETAHNVVPTPTLYTVSYCENQRRKQYQCTQCKFRSLYKSHLVTHVRVHTGDRPFKCTQCEYSASHKSTLTTHIRSHTEDKPFQCTQCKYRSFYKSHLVTHLRVHTGDKPFKCPQCEYSASHKSTLTTHIRTHTGDKPYKCHQCEYRASKKSYLNSHLRLHSADKPFKCPECKYSATWKSSLVIHSKVHTRDKPYKCTDCDYRASKKSHLIQHLRVHSGDKSFECDHCTYRTSNKYNLKSHLRVHVGNKHFI